MPRHAVRTGPQEGVDLVQDGAFAALQALVLAFVLLPGADYERLLEQIAIGGDQALAAGTGSPTAGLRTGPTVGEVSGVRLIAAAVYAPEGMIDSVA